MNIWVWKACSWKCQFENSRNGKSRKTVKSKAGSLELEVPQDRQGTFEPVIIPKRKRVLDGLEDHIISLYTYGMSTRDIESHMKEIYGLSFSESTISNITDKIIDHIEAFKTRRLDALYYIVWMDAIVFKSQARWQGNRQVSADSHRPESTW